MTRPIYSSMPVIAALLATTVVLVYWTGLHGPFLLDDQNNLYVIDRWLQGQASLRDVLFGGSSGLSSRPVSMSSFALGATLWGTSAFAYKLGNLALHLLCGSLAYLLVRRMAQQDDRLGKIAGLTALLVAALWLLHPLNASTVLYAVQRMAQLSALFLMLGMWFYLIMRKRLQARPTAANTVALFAGIGGILVTGFLAKENTVLLPALCLVLELGYYSREPRPRAVRWFFAVSVWLPLLLGLIAFAINPARLLGGYVNRDFNMLQRLLSEARALCDYLWLIVVPNPPRMGVYVDDFAASTGLLSPPTTLIAVLFLTSVSLGAWRLRRRIPSLFVGWGIFLVGHALESTVIPLELYFEHRNYLPMLGILYALVGLAVVAGDGLQTIGLRAGRIGVVLGAGVLFLYAFGTHGRARVWSTAESLAISAVTSHPHSVRANMLLVKTAFEYNNPGLAERSLHTLSTASSPRARAYAHLIGLYYNCLARHDADPRDLVQGMALLPLVITTMEAEFFSALFFNTPQGCGRVNDANIAEALGRYVDRVHLQPDGHWQKWFMRGTAARFYMRAGDPANAYTQAQRAWQPGTDVGMASLVIQTQLATGDIAGARRTLADARGRIDPADAQATAWLQGLGTQIAAASRTSPPLITR